MPQTFCMTYSTDIALTKVLLIYKDIILREKDSEMMEFMYWGKPAKQLERWITHIALFGPKVKVRSCCSTCLRQPLRVFPSMIYWKLPPKAICKGFIAVGLLSSDPYCPHRPCWQTWPLWKIPILSGMIRMTVAMPRPT